MDYDTIGKDVGAWYWTNDTELVANRELRQQMQLTPCVAANFMTGPHMGPTPESDAQKTKDYYDWCERNNLGDYVDYMSPENRLGRLRLGEIVGDYNIEQIQTMAIEFPTIKEIITIDDK